MNKVQYANSKSSTQQCYEEMLTKMQKPARSQPFIKGEMLTIEVNTKSSSFLDNSQSLSSSEIELDTEKPGKSGSAQREQFTYVQKHNKSHQVNQKGSGPNLNQIKSFSPKDIYNQQRPQSCKFSQFKHLSTNYFGKKQEKDTIISKNQEQKLKKKGAEKREAKKDQACPLGDKQKRRKMYTPVSNTVRKGSQKKQKNLKIFRSLELIKLDEDLNSCDEVRSETNARESYKIRNQISKNRKQSSQVRVQSSENYGFQKKNKKSETKQFFNNKKTPKNSSINVNNYLGTNATNLNLKLYSPQGTKNNKKFDLRTPNNINQADKQTQKQRGNYTKQKLSQPELQIQSKQKESLKLNSLISKMDNDYLSAKLSPVPFQFQKPFLEENPQNSFRKEYQNFENLISQRQKQQKQMQSDQDQKQAKFNQVKNKKLNNRQNTVLSLQSTPKLLSPQTSGRVSTCTTPKQQNFDLKSFQNKPKLMWQNNSKGLIDFLNTEKSTMLQKLKRSLLEQKSKIGGKESRVKRYALNALIDCV